MKATLFLIVNIVLKIYGCSGSNDERRLMDNLLVDYNRLGRPVQNSSHPVQVQVGLTLLSVEMKKRNRYEMQASSWHDMIWKDEYLKWDPVEYGGIEDIRLPASKIWLPDLTIYSSTPVAFDLRNMKSFDVTVYDSGDVFWAPSTAIKVLCEGDHGRSQNQTCVSKLGSWTYSGLAIDLQLSSSPPVVDIVNYTENPCWRLEDTKAVREVTRYECCREPYIALIFEFTLNNRC